MKKIVELIVVAALVICGVAPAGAQESLLSGATATGAGTAAVLDAGLRTFQAYGTTTAGSGAATIKIQGSNVDSPSLDGHWVDLGTITLTLGTTSTGDGFASWASWRRVRANVTAISGTGAAVTVNVRAR